MRRVFTLLSVNFSLVILCVSPALARAGREDPLDRGIKGALSAGVLFALIYVVQAIYRHFTKEEKGESVRERQGTRYSVERAYSKVNKFENPVMEKPIKEDEYATKDRFNLQNSPESTDIEATKSDFQMGKEFEPLKTQEIDRYLQVFRLKRGASEEEIKKAHKHLVGSWVSYRFSNDPHLREKANEKIKEINIIYEKLKSCIAGETLATSEGKSHDRSQPPPDDPPPRSEEKQQSETNDNDYNGFQPPPKQRSGRVQPHAVETIHAGFWDRFAAVFIDSLILAVGSTMLSLPFFIAKGLSRNPNSLFWVVFDFILFVLLGWLYYALLESSPEQATLGKRAVGIIVTDINGNRISFGRASGRWLGKTISFLILGIGYVMAGFTQKKQALHDIMANTLVLERPEGVRSWLTVTIVGGQVFILSVFLVFILIQTLTQQLTKTADYTQTASAPSSSLSREQPTSTQPPSETELNATDWYNRGTSLSKSGMYREAIEAYSRAIDLNPRFAGAYFGRGIACGNKGQHDQAISDYNKAIELNPREALTYRNRGIAYGDKGQHDQAISDYSKAIELNPRDAVAYSARGIAYGDKGQHDQAISDYSKAIELNPRETSNYGLRGFVYMKKRQYDQAISDFSKAIELNPRETSNYPLRGFAYDSKGQYDQAISDFSKAIELNPRDDTAYWGRGKVYSKKGQHDQAISDFSKAIELNPRDAEAYNGRGDAYGNKGQHDQAISDFNKAIELNPRYAWAYYVRGITYHRKGQYDQAISDHSKAIELNPRFAEAYKNRGLAYLRKGQYDKAVEDLNKAIDMKPDDSPAYDNRGYAYLELGTYQSATRDFKKAIELNEKYVDSYVGLAIVSFLQKRTEEAKAYYQKAVQIEPLCKNGLEALEKEKGYFYTPNQRATVKAILKLK